MDHLLLDSARTAGILPAWFSSRHCSKLTGRQATATNRSGSRMPWKHGLDQHNVTWPSAGSDPVNRRLPVSPARCKVGRKERGTIPRSRARRSHGKLSFEIAAIGIASISSSVTSLIRLNPLRLIRSLERRARKPRTRSSMTIEFCVLPICRKESCGPSEISPRNAKSSRDLKSRLRVAGDY